jgi:hypothetical protein
MYSISATCHFLLNFPDLCYAPYIEYLEQMYSALPENHEEKDEIRRIRNSIAMDVAWLNNQRWKKIQIKLTQIFSSHLSLLPPPEIGTTGAGAGAGGAGGAGGGAGVGAHTAIASPQRRHYLVREGALNAKISMAQSGGDAGSSTDGGDILFWFYLFHDILIGSPPLPSTSSSKTPSVVFFLSCVWIIDLPSVDEFSWSFLLVTPEQQLILSARSHAEKREWLYDLSECINYNVNANSPSSYISAIRRVTAFFNRNPKKALSFLKDNDEILRGTCWCAMCLRARSSQRAERERREGGGAGGEGQRGGDVRKMGEDHEHFCTAVALFMYENEELDKEKVGVVLGGGDAESKMILAHFVRLFPFHGVPFEYALRLFLQAFRLPGEAQSIDRIVNTFASHYSSLNPLVFRSPDTAYILAFSVIMLNTDAHNPSIKRKMAEEEFIRNNRGIDSGADLPPHFLASIYRNIVQVPFNQLKAAILTPRKVWMVQNAGYWLSFERIAILRKEKEVASPYTAFIYRDPLVLWNAFGEDVTSEESLFSCSSTRRFATYHFQSGEVYEGEWANGKRHGFGSVIHRNGSVYEGEWEVDEWKGSGEFRYDFSRTSVTPSSTSPAPSQPSTSPDPLPPSQSPSATSSDGKVHSQCVFSGNWIKWRGEGIVKYGDGRSMSGEWAIDPVTHGRGFLFGKMIIPDTECTFCGCFTNHVLNGFGVLRYPDRRASVGNWNRGLQCGAGMMMTSQGSLFLGLWTNNIVDGYGKWYSTDGTIITGRFRGIFPDGFHIDEGSVSHCDLRTFPYYQFFSVKGSPLANFRWDFGCLLRHALMMDLEEFPLSGEISGGDESGSANLFEFNPGSLDTGAFRVNPKSFIEKLVSLLARLLDSLIGELDRAVLALPYMVHYVADFLIAFVKQVCAIRAMWSYQLRDYTGPVALMERVFSLPIGSILFKCFQDRHKKLDPFLSKNPANSLEDDAPIEEIGKEESKCAEESRGGEKSSLVGEMKREEMEMVLVHIRKFKTAVGPYAKYENLQSATRAVREICSKTSMDPGYYWRRVLRTCHIRSIEADVDFILCYSELDSPQADMELIQTLRSWGSFFPETSTFDAPFSPPPPVV